MKADCQCYNVNLSAVGILFDAYPEAILSRDSDGKTPVDLARGRSPPYEQHAELVSFLQAQLIYAQKAQVRFAMTTPDQSGWLPLHHALHERATLGAIKLLVKGNPAALQVAESRGKLPLHIACEFCSVEVAQYLVELDSSCLNAHDANENLPFHYACRGGNCGAIKYLLGKSAPSVSKRNADNKLPIHLLCEYGGDTNVRESLIYVEAIWLLLLAHPETVLS